MRGFYFIKTRCIQTVALFGIFGGCIRLSIGLEDWHDIIRDLELALEQV